MSNKNNQQYITEGQYSILVVEDDDGINQLVQKTLQRAGHETEGVLTGKEAIEKISRNSYSLILLDYKMPDMNAKEIIDKLVRQNNTVPFMVMTGHGDERVAMEMIKLGTRDYIVKDAGFLDFLTEKVNRVICELGMEKRLAEAEEELRESEELYRTLFINNPAETIIVDTDGMIIAFNKAKEMSGDRLPEIGNKMYVDYASQHKIDMYFELIECIKFNKIKRFPEQEYGDGKKSLSITIAPYYGGAIITSENITKRKLAEKAMQENEGKFRAVFNEALDGIVLTNTDNGMIVDANPEFQRITGRSINQLRTMHIWNLRPEDNIEQAKKAFKEAIEYEDHSIRKINFLQPSGIVVPAEFKAHKVVIRDREYILSIVRNITDRIQSEKDIKFSEEKFQNLFEESLDAVYITDKDGTIIDMNLAGCKMLSYSRDELIGLNALDTYVNEENRINLQEEVEEKGSVKDFEVALKKKDGSQIICMISATSRKDSAGDIIGYQGIIHDMTNRIIIEQRYRDEFQRAEFYNDLMTHDVRNYNQGIMSNLELMNLSEELPEDAKRYSRNALNQVIGSSKLITNLQMLSELKNRPAPVSDMDVIPFISDAIDYAKTSFPDKKITMDFPDENGSIIIKGNSILLELFNNILTNAVKFDRNQEVHLEIKITEQKDFYKFEFKDHGPGIDDSMKSRVFERASRIDKEIWGTGLGLTLVKRIVESLNGEIWVEDRIEGERTEGSNFILKLPRRDISG